MKIKLITGKPWLHFCPMTLALHVRVEYANFDCEVNQSENGLSFTEV